jgi:hypothetical protein
MPPPSLQGSMLLLMIPEFPTFAKNGFSIEENAVFGKREKLRN